MNNYLKYNEEFSKEERNLLSILKKKRMLYDKEHRKINPKIYRKKRKKVLPPIPESIKNKLEEILFNDIINSLPPKKIEKILKDVNKRNSDTRSIIIKYKLVNRFLKRGITKQILGIETKPHGRPRKHERIVKTENKERLSEVDCYAKKELEKLGWKPKKVKPTFKNKLKGAPDFTCSEDRFVEVKQMYDLDDQLVYWSELCEQGKKVFLMLVRPNQGGGERKGFRIYKVNIAFKRLKEYGFDEEDYNFNDD